jgi:hypothetical protein
MTVGEIRAIINDPLLNDNSEAVVGMGYGAPFYESPLEAKIITGGPASARRLAIILRDRFDRPGRVSFHAEQEEEDA